MAPQRHKVCTHLERQSHLSSLRTQGPIPRDPCCRKESRPAVDATNSSLWLWVPAFAGTTGSLWPEWEPLSPLTFVSFLDRPMWVAMDLGIADHSKSASSEKAAQIVVALLADTAQPDLAAAQFCFGTSSTQAEKSCPDGRDSRSNTAVVAVRTARAADRPNTPWWRICRRRIDDIDHGNRNVMWSTASAIPKWHRLSTSTMERSITTKESNVGLTDGSPGFKPCKILPSLRSETPSHRLGSKAR
jgi:hypothetical protein